MTQRSVEAIVAAKVCTTAAETTTRKTDLQITPPASVDPLETGVTPTAHHHVVANPSAVRSPGWFGVRLGT